MPWSDSLRSFISLKDGAVSAPFRRVTAKHRSLGKMYLLTTNQMWLLKTNLLLTWARTSAAWNCNMQSLDNDIACVSERRRIPSPKTSRLQQEADEAERNQASLRLMLQELPSWFQVKEYLATFQDARRMLAVRYRHTPNSELGPVVHSIHEEGQRRHTNSSKTDNLP